MLMLAVDPNPKGLSNLIEAVGALHPEGAVIGFGDPLLAAKYGATHEVDALYTAVEMNRLDGFGLARMLRGWHPEIRLNFLADTEDWRADAIRIGMNSYALLPVSVVSLGEAEAADDW